MLLHRGGRERSPQKGYRRGGRINRNKDHVSLTDADIDFSREKEVFAPRSPHDLVKAWLVDRKHIGVPLCDSLLVYIHHRHGMVRTLVRDHGHGRPPHITSSDTANFHV